MNETANLSLPYILASQAQKHVTHNEAIRALDCLVQLSVESRVLTGPPASPVRRQPVRGCSRRQRCVGGRER